MGNGRKLTSPAGDPTMGTYAIFPSTVLATSLSLPSALITTLLALSFIVQFVNSNIFASSGSPNGLPSSIFNECVVASASSRLGSLPSVAVGLAGASDSRSEEVVRNGPRDRASRSAQRTPSTSSPSAVSVPVLSKQTTLILPATLIRCGEIQYISCLRKRAMEKVTQIDMAAGRAGGMQIVKSCRSRKV